MNDHEINIAIAEACGWRYSDKFDHWEKDGQVAFCDGDSLHYRQLPLYATDLNAMHEAEKMLSDDDYFNYCRMALPKAQQSEIAQGRTAKARQRAEAFLRTLGKWKD